jgi:lipid-binding SYLF domain-containing protein
MRKYVLFAVSLLLALSSFAQEKENDRLKESYNVLKEILGAPDKGIPHDLLDKAECVVVYPSVKKLAIGIGGSYGRGVELEKASGVRGVRRPCLRWKVPASDSKSVARPQTSFS